MNTYHGQNYIMRELFMNIVSTCMICFSKSCIMYYLLNNMHHEFYSFVRPALLFYAKNLSLLSLNEPLNMYLHYRGGKSKTPTGKGKKGAKAKTENYDLIVHIDLEEWRLSNEQVWRLI